MTIELANFMTVRYPYPAIRVPRIGRKNEKSLGDLQLTEKTVQQLSEDELGILIGNCGSVEMIQEMLFKLISEDYSNPWVIVLQSRQIVSDWYRHYCRKYECEFIEDTHLPDYWKCGSGYFTTFEGLKSLEANRELTGTISAILMVDPQLITHRCRGGGKYGNHDRPQLLLDFRMNHAEENFVPPLVFLSVPPVKSLNTLSPASVYGLATWWYADGSRLRVGRPPVV